MACKQQGNAKLHDPHAAHQGPLSASVLLVGVLEGVDSPQEPGTQHHMGQDRCCLHVFVASAKSKVVMVCSSGQVIGDADASCIDTRLTTA